VTQGPHAVRRKRRAELGWWRRQREAEGELHSAHYAGLSLALERRLEKTRGANDSVPLEPVPYDHSAGEDREWILVAKLERGPL
jgi:hypothetical protein